MASKPAPFGRARSDDLLATVDETELLELLTDDRCRAILDTVSKEAHTAGELIDDLDIPRSTLYRKVDRLVEAELLRERTRIDASGNHQNEYVRQFDAVSLEVDFGAGLEISVADGSAADPEPNPLLGAGAD